MTDIKTMLENDDYIIIPDTSVLLNIYRYSPEFSEFSLECLKKVSDSIYLPAIPESLTFSKRLSCAIR